jgi:hypothetical protein
MLSVDEEREVSRNQIIWSMKPYPFYVKAGTGREGLRRADASKIPATKFTKPRFKIEKEPRLRAVYSDRSTQVWTSLDALHPPDHLRSRLGTQKLQYKTWPTVSKREGIRYGELIREPKPNCSTITAHACFFRLARDQARGYGTLPN